MGPLFAGGGDSDGEIPLTVRLLISGLFCGVGCAVTLLPAAFITGVVWVLYHFGGRKGRPTPPKE